MLEEGFRRAELLLGGLTQRWDTQEGGAGTGGRSSLQTGTGEFSSPPRDQVGPTGDGGREGRALPWGGKESIQGKQCWSSKCCGRSGTSRGLPRQANQRSVKGRRRLSCESDFTGQKRQQ